MSEPTPGASTPGGNIALPTQPDGASWPTLTWATAEQRSGDPERLAVLLDDAFDPERPPDLAQSHAFIAVQGGRIVAERYGPGTSSTTPLLSWSTAKSVTHAALGIAARRGLLDPSAPVAAPEWSAHDDPRAAITTDDLLEMRSGLHFVEDYLDDESSNCIEMLFGDGADDVAHYAAAQQLEHPIGTVFNYSSGTTNILSRQLALLLGGGDEPDLRRSTLESFLHDELFDPLGMCSIEARFDAAGTFVGSSYLYATARDYARFGLLYLRDGVWDGRRILPEGWVDAARTIRSQDAENGWYYGRHWWVRGDEFGTFWANGYEGQVIACVPALDLVVVRLGKTPATLRPQLEGFWHDVVACFV